MMKQVALFVLLVGGCLVAISSAGAQGVNFDEDERFAPVFAERGTGQRATVEETREAISKLWEEIENVEITDDTEMREELEATHKRFGELVEICQLNRANCARVFKLIESVRADLNEDLINLAPYVEDCLEQQSMYCGQK